MYNDQRITCDSVAVKPPLAAAVTQIIHLLPYCVFFYNHCGRHLSYSSLQDTVAVIAVSQWKLQAFVYGGLFLKSYYNVSIRLRSGHQLVHFYTLVCFFSAILYLLLFLALLSCCVTQFDPSFSFQIGGLTFVSRILWYRKEFMVDSITARCPGFCNKRL